MPDADFLASLGLFVHRDFLDPELCAHLRSAALAAPRVPSVVTRPDGETLVEEVRRSYKVKVGASTSALVETRFPALMPELERHFLVTLSSWQPLQFLLYREGDWFGPHRDRHTEDFGDGIARGNRQVTMVLFLNGQADDGEESFSGGYLTFYGLVAGAPALPLPLIAEPGLLIAFRSDLMHSVTSITRGTRFCIAGWFV